MSCGDNGHHLTMGGVAVLGALEEAALDKRLGLRVITLHDEMVLVVEAKADVIICESVVNHAFPISCDG